MKEVYGFAASGGGSKGAWGAGVSHYLISDLNKDYKYLSGTSTGALFLNFVALRDTNTLKEVYTNVTNNDIFTIQPYRKGKDGKIKLNYIRIIWNLLIKGKKTFGDSNKLREELIPKFFTQDSFKLINSLKKDCIVAVTNLTKGKTEYKELSKESYEDFLDWTFASTCATPFMSLVNKDNCDYVDGGFIEHIPIQALINKGCTSIDIIDHSSSEIKIERVRNLLNLITRSFEVSLRENTNIDFQMTKLNTIGKNVKLNVYRPNGELTRNSLFFDKENMLKWWNEGYNFTKKYNPQSYLLTPDHKIKKLHRIPLKSDNI